MDPRSSTSRPQWPEVLWGGRSVRALLPLLGALPPLSDHPNRQLQTRDVFVAHLLAFFNPTLRSLRALEDFSQTRQARRYLTVPRLAKSTLADCHRLADPGTLRPLVEHLLAQLGRRGVRAPDGLPDTVRQVLAVDGTFLALAADVAWAVQHKTNTGQAKASVRVDVHLDVASWVPQVVNVHGAGTSEPASASGSIQPGAVHLYDRGFFDFGLIGRHLEQAAAAPAPFVLRLREPGVRSPRFERQQDLPLTDPDRAAGVVADALGRLAGSRHRRAPAATLREVVIVNPDEAGGVVRLLTDLHEVPARVIGLLYRYRWQVELFFRWLKVTAGFRHLLSQRRAAIAFEVYVAVIGTLLLVLRWHARPSKYAYSLLALVANGTATAAEVLPILAERERRCAQDRESRRQRQARRAAEAAR